MKILIATTNQAKIERYSAYFKAIDPSLKLQTLLDLDFEMVEPVENGQDELENSQIKAKYYLQQTQFDGLVFAEDTGMNLLNVDLVDNPKKDLKKPVLERFGNIEPENIVKFYAELAQKYGGKITQEWIYGFTLASADFIQSTTAKSTSFLVSKIKKPIDLGHPLGAICLVDEINSKYWNELIHQEKFDFFDSKIIPKIQNLLTPFLK